MSDLIVLPRAVVEALRDECLNGQRKSIRATGYRIVDILAAAKPVVDEAVTHAVTFSSRPDAQCFVETQALWEVPARGTYRVLLIAADAAEEG